MSDVTLGEAFAAGEIGDQEATLSLSLREMLVLQQLLNFSPPELLEVAAKHFGPGWTFAMTTGQMKIANRVGRMIDADWVIDWAATMQAEVEQQIAEWKDAA